MVFVASAIHASVPFEYRTETAHAFAGGAQPEIEKLERSPTRATPYRVAIECERLELDPASQMQPEPPNDPGRP